MTEETPAAIPTTLMAAEEETAGATKADTLLAEEDDHLQPVTLSNAESVTAAAPADSAMSPVSRYYCSKLLFP